MGMSSRYDGRQGTAAPTVGPPLVYIFYILYTVKLPLPYRWLGCGAGEASGGTLDEPVIVPRRFFFRFCLV